MALTLAIYLDKADTWPHPAHEFPYEIVEMRFAQFALREAIEP